jgi:uncharacterized protein (DUF488 family)
MNNIALRDPRTLADLTQVLFGEALSMDELFARVEHVGRGAATSKSIPSDARWIGSIGYECHKDVRDFVQLLRDAGVERLIDVRELPMSRRRGYGKTALSEALSAAGIEYVHMRALGNPKPFRDLYKSGLIAEGRELYQRHLLEECRFALHDLANLLSDDKRSALMCVEHNPSTCHRTVIIDAMRDELDLNLDVTQLG